MKKTFTKIVAFLLLGIPSTFFAAKESSWHVIPDRIEIKANFDHKPLCDDLSKRIKQLGFVGLGVCLGTSGILLGYKSIANILSTCKKINSQKPEVKESPTQKVMPWAVEAVRGIAGLTLFFAGFGIVKNSDRLARSK